MADTLPDKAADVIDWIDEVEGNEQRQRAREALRAENERSGGPRTTVVDHVESLGEMAGAGQPGVGRTPPAPIVGPGPGH